MGANICRGPQKEPENIMWKRNGNKEIREIRNGNKEIREIRKENKMGKNRKK